MPPEPALRADPLNRPQRRGRRSFGIWRDARAAWALTLGVWRHNPALFAAALVGWGALRFACLSGLRQAHFAAGGRPTLLELAGLFVLAVTADLGPLLLAACLWPVQHRLILKAAAPAMAVQAARAARMLGAGFLLAICAAAALGCYVAVPLVALPLLGRISTLLTLILLLPGLCLALLWLFRASLGLPAISLGLRRAFAEGWEIGRFQVSRTLCVWVLAYLPVGLALGLCAAARLDRLGWADCLARPLLDVLAVSLTGSLSGLFYRQLRLPAALRPDRRPSWNRDARLEPAVVVRR